MFKNNAETRRRVFTLFSLLLLVELTLCAQLNPSITLGTAPQDSDPICSIPVYSGSFYTSGLSKGSIASDFTLYGLNGDSLHLGSVLAEGKPLLLVNGSLTCPVFRNKIPVLHQMANAYGNLITVAVVITVEAHPTDPSPYYGYVNITSQNQQEGILYPQPITYGERKALAQIAVSHTGLTVPVFLDRPCQEWWLQYGPAPNNAYVFLPDGTIAVKHGWFHRMPDQMFCDLDSLLSVTSGLCTPTGVGGNFRAEPVNLYSSGFPGDILFNYIDLITGPQGGAEILIMKLVENYAPDWESSFCADICYSTLSDSIVIYIPANDTMKFSLDFFSSEVPGSSSVKVGFRNQNNPLNKFSFVLEGSTLVSGISGVSQDSHHPVQVFSAAASFPDSWGTPDRIFTLDGRLFSVGSLELPHIPGVYIVFLSGSPYRILVTP